MHLVLVPAAVDSEGLIEHAHDSTAPEGWVFFHAMEGKPLATPWQVASLRASMLAEHALPEGWLVDCACGSGIQLAAYGCTLQRPVLGIELDGSRAQASAVNLNTIARHQGSTEQPWFTDSRILSGDGTDAMGALSAASRKDSIAFLHLDPARPRNSRTHDIEEMQPPLHEVLTAWKPHFTDKPSFLLDLSPRLTQDQRGEVERLVQTLWPGLEHTWEWTSRGRGRVDRLAMWAGAIASTGVARRFVRVPPSLSEQALVLSEPSEFGELAQLLHPPKRGEYVSIIDAALVESGLAPTWLAGVSKEKAFRWAVITGRRPQVHHDHPLRLNSQQRMLVQATGRVVELLPMNLDETTIDRVVEQAIEHNFRSVKLRLDLEPSQQPVLQGSLDRQLHRRSGVRDGFLTKHPTNNVLLLCVSHAEDL